MKPNIIYGRIPCLNALKGKNRVKSIFLNEKHPDQEIITLAKEINLPISLVDKQKLDSLSSNSNHQGVLCYVEEFSFTPLNNVLNNIKEKKEATIVLLDQISDPVNFGSIIRSSAAFNVDAIIIGKNRQVQITPVVAKIATGAEELIPIVQVVNLSQTIEKLKQENFWIVTSAGEAKQNYDEIDYSCRVCLVVGSEGFGVSRLIKERSDFVAKIPLSDKVNALNANIATAVFLAQISSYRNKK